MLRGASVSSKMNVPSMSALELILQLECLKQLLIATTLMSRGPDPLLFD